MALRKLIAGNWKMNGSLAALAELDGIAKAAAENEGVDVAICPPSTLIAAAAARAPSLSIGGQDCHWNDSGAHTGCISVAMLAEAGASMVIVGHSERRTDNHETSAEVRQKAKAAVAAGLTAIICVGETEAERDEGRAVAVVTGQVADSVPATSIGASTVVAYEPVWAIGTGRVIG
jgi:triosephosphate isomerase (TIM)